MVITTYQRPALLGRLLDALGDQTLAPEEFEIIVCDAAGHDDTRAQTERWRAAHAVPVAYVDARAPANGPQAMRNAGWRTARGEIIAFTDDVTIPAPDWLRQGLLALEDDAADAASGRIVVPLPDAPTGDERAVTWLERAAFVTANCFCRRTVLERVGGFDPRFRAAWRENSDLLVKLIRGGFDVVHAMDAIVVHPVCPAPRGVSFREQGKRVLNALVDKSMSIPVLSAYRRLRAGAALREGLR